MNTKLLVIAALGMAMMASCSDKKTEETDAQAVARNAKPQVKLATVQMESIPQTGTYTATVESDVKNNITPNAPNRIEKIMVEVGDYVQKGQCLVQLDESSLDQLSLQIEHSKVEYNRTKSLYEAGGASKSELDNMAMQIEVMGKQYKLLAENTKLYAPISGIVTARNYDNGDMYSGAMPILTVEQTNPVKLLVHVSENHYKDVKKGQPVDVTLDAYEGESFVGKVSIITPSVDATTHTFPVEVTIANPSQKVRPGMFARATINFGDADHVLIPDEALVKQIGAGDRYVYVYHKETNTVSYNKVDLGQHIGKNYEIFGGVEPGDQVVIAGQARLNNGKEVEVVE